MTNLYIDDFKHGLDTRRSILTAEPGSLRALDNCVISPGGEIQKRMAFIKVLTLAAGTAGLHGTNTGADGTEQVWVFKFGTPGASATLGTVALANGYNVQIMSQSLQSIASRNLSNVSAVEEYGAQHFFVCGTTVPNTGSPVPAVSNWWQGSLVASYVGVAPLLSLQKVYRLSGSVVYFSGIGDPSVTNPLNPLGTGPNTVNPGSGFIDLGLVDSGARYLVGLEAYYKQIAIFARHACILYNMDPDPANNQVMQVLRVGAISNGSIIQFGTGDVIFLSDSGIRSLRAINVTLAAGVNDLGSPIDNIIQAAVLANPAGSLISEAIVDPLTGRYWIAIGSTIYVLSYWPSSKINAWSTFTVPFQIDHMTVAGTRIYLRSGDDIYLYGGLDNATYDASVATVRTPHHAAETPTTVKKAMTIDAMVQGTWAISVGMAPDNPDFYELAATITGNSYAMMKVPFAGSGTHIGFTLTCADASPAMLGAMSVSFQKTIEK